MHAAHNSPRPLCKHDGSQFDKGLGPARREAAFEGSRDVVSVYAGGVEGDALDLAVDCAAAAARAGSNLQATDTLAPS